jgi:hypothetical protein
VIEKHLQLIEDDNEVIGNFKKTVLSLLKERLSLEIYQTSYLQDKFHHFLIQGI